MDIDVLMVVAAGTAAAAGHAGEGALLLVLFTFAGALEQLAMERTKREINGLKAIMPDRAIVLRDGVWQDVRPEEVEVGETVRVRPGDRVPVDAEITEGASSVDQSTLTGESMPRSVDVGDEVFAGTINGEGVLLTRVRKPASESSVQRILTLVTDAREQREPLQRAIDRVGEPYTFSVLAVSAAVFLLWWLALPEIVGGRRSIGEAAYTAITLLIVMSPCALVIATPTATLAAIARGARAGVLFKGGESIDRLSRTEAVCFDKTGTLTVGRPVFCEMIAREAADGADLLAVAAGLEQDSTHPTARDLRRGRRRRAGCWRSRGRRRRAFDRRAGDGRPVERARCAGGEPGLHRRDRGRGGGGVAGRDTRGGTPGRAAGRRGGGSGAAAGTTASV
ncbi:MAG: cation-translocating P-type ATPase [Planctomycetota bacterium]|nr:MAG: cation-translocating P-type ATPase [Planctomycetota bacterium]